MATDHHITKPRIYVACLASYNNGILHGAWIDADREAWEIYDEVRAMLDTSRIGAAEEFAIHDYEGFESVRIDEYTGLGEVAEIAAFIGEHGTVGGMLIAHFGGDLEEARSALEDRYFGCYPSLADYVQDLTEEAVSIPETLRYYIDWEAIARDAELSGDLFTIVTSYGKVHIFAGQ